MRRIIIHQTFGGNKLPIGTEGFFHGWGLESSEWRGHIAEWEVPPTGMASDTVAIIELDDGRVVYAFPEQIRFVEPYAIAAKLAATPANIARACGMENEVEEVSSWPPAPPNGYELANDGDIKRSGYLEWRAFGWAPGISWSVGDRCQDDMLIANPIEVAP